MKKRIITLLAILAVMVACAVFAVQADAPAVTTTFVCPCATCAAAREAGTTTTNVGNWTQITASSKTINTGGHYYINTDETIASLSVNEKNVVLLIDNATVTFTSNRAFNMANTGKKSNPTLHLVGNNGAEILVTTSSSMGGIAQCDSFKVAGNTFDDLIIKYVRREYGVEIGPLTAEKVKKQIGTAVKRPVEIAIMAKGRNISVTSIVSSLP